MSLAHSHIDIHNVFIVGTVHYDLCISITLDTTSNEHSSRVVVYQNNRKLGEIIDKRSNLHSCVADCLLSGESLINKDIMSCVPRVTK